MSGHTRHAAGINRRSALIGLGMSFATMRWSAAAAADEPIVETACGKVRGIQQPGVIVFRGIRYGEGTAGARFLPPVAARPWAGTVMQRPKPHGSWAPT
jgi:para-nitrobenzyl esterase